ncbi:MAG TPA: low affinity iron permease family protein [Candidatus Saccharimonadia bacterium]
MKMEQKQPDLFTRFATQVATMLGHSWVFMLALVTLVVWALTGPLTKFSNTWQLIINTGTTIVTFLMVFIIQNTQNRDNLAINLKLDALLKASEVNEQKMIGLEDKSDLELQKEKEKEQSAERSAA